ncbi:MAG: L-seryl-tRNA(Sec) selenium transferase, partial [Ottowia sp.]
MAAPEESVVHGSQACQHPSDTPNHELVQPQQLPALDRLLRQHSVAALVQAHGHTLVATEARALLATLRAQALARTLGAARITADSLAQQLEDRLRQRLAPALRRVLNLTGTVIHTN